LGPSNGSSFANAERSGSRRGVRKSVRFDGPPDGRCYRGELFVGEGNCRHGPDMIGRHLSSKDRVDIATPDVLLWVGQ
jgi:hypothetical protein